MPCLALWTFLFLLSFTCTVMRPVYSRSPCESQPCLHNGTCIERASTRSLAFSCKCQFPHAGRQCQESIVVRFCRDISGAWSETTNTCFEKSHPHGVIPKNWSDAYTLCADAAPDGLKGRLAIIQSEAVYNLLRHRHGWTGIRARNHSSVTKHNERTEFPYKDEWAFYEQDRMVAPLTWTPKYFLVHGNHELHCIRLSGLGYQDYDCTTGKDTAICEFLIDPDFDPKNWNSYCALIPAVWCPATNSCLKVYESRDSHPASYDDCVSRAPAGFRARLAFISTESVYNIFIKRLPINSFFGSYDKFWFGLKAKYFFISKYSGIGDKFPFKNEWAFYEKDTVVANLTWVPENVEISGGFSDGCMQINMTGDYRHASCSDSSHTVCEFLPVTEITLSWTHTATASRETTTIEIATNKTAISVEESSMTTTDQLLISADTTYSANTTGKLDCWYSWLPWSDCTRSCGLGKRTRNREKPDNVICYGDSFETGFCKNDPCAVCQWNDWGQWGICSSACAIGTRTKFKTKWSHGLNDSAADCQGPKMETANCTGSCQEPIADLETEDTFHKSGLILDVDDGNSVSASVHDTLPYMIANFGEKVKLRLGHNFSYTVPLCLYDGKLCDRRDWKSFYDGTTGNCFTFNFANRPKYDSYRAGAQQGLLLVLQASQLEYICSSQSAGFRLQIHNYTERPFPDNTGISIPVGVTVAIGIKRTVTSRLPPPYGDCIGDRLEPFYYRGNYTVEGCLRSCIQQTLVKKCDCGYPSIPLPIDNSKYCNIDKKKCMDYYRECGDHDLMHTCGHCKQPCFETAFSHVVSTSELKRNDLLRYACREFTPDNETLYNHCLMTYKQNYAVVEIYYETLNSMLFVESPAYTFINLCSDFAGIMGIILGASVISLFEFVYAIVDLIIFSLTAGKGTIIHTYE